MKDDDKNDALDALDEAIDDLSDLLETLPTGARKLVQQAIDLLNKAQSELGNDE